MEIKVEAVRLVLAELLVERQRNAILVMLLTQVDGSAVASVARMDLLEAALRARDGA